MTRSKRIIIMVSMKFFFFGLGVRILRYLYETNESKFIFFHAKNINLKGLYMRNNKNQRNLISSRDN